MKILMILARCLFVICLPVLLLTATIAGAVNCNWLYTHGFEKYDVRQSLADNGLNLTDADMAGIARGFIHYFNSNEEYISLTVQQDGKAVPLFNTDETIHFKDVKGLFRFDYDVLLGTFIYCLAFSILSVFWRKEPNRMKLAGNTIIGSVVTLGLMLLMGIGTLVNFDTLFYDFHLIAFSNNFWSVEGNMLLLFPDGFWYDAAVYIVITIAVLALLLGGISWAYLARTKRNAQRKLLQT
jgi:integral membrane protein (TIGR01906 family)